MAYNTDFKQGALDYIKEGHCHVEVAKVFDVGVRTLFTWGKERREQGHLDRKKRVVKKRKIPLDELKAFVEAHPDAFLREIAAHFDCAVPSVWAALKQIHVTLKKTTSFKEQNPEKVAEFLDILNSLKDLLVVYIDETGIDRYLYRPYARAPRGEKVYEKISGRGVERTSIVTGQVDGEFIAPMIYKGSMTSDFFVEWFKTQLLPALKTTHVIVMDNASFHPRNILDELCIQDKHLFLPLPPYSPNLNPIEQAWAILKKKVTDLLREVPNIFECLECFFKTT